MMKEERGGEKRGVVSLLFLPLLPYSRITSGAVSLFLIPDHG